MSLRFWLRPTDDPLPPGPTGRRFHLALPRRLWGVCATLAQMWEMEEEEEREGEGIIVPYEPANTRQNGVWPALRAAEVILLAPEVNEAFVEDLVGRQLMEWRDLSEPDRLLMATAVNQERNKLQIGSPLEEVTDAALEERLACMHKYFTNLLVAICSPRDRTEGELRDLFIQARRPPTMDDVLAHTSAQQPQRPWMQDFRMEGEGEGEEGEEEDEGREGVKRARP